MEITQRAEPIACAGRLIDLFSGVGGLTLGAMRAGFAVVAAVENDPKSIEAHRRNFPNVVHLERDVSTLTGTELLRSAGLEVGELDGLIGGPPCQGFSIIGHRNVEDPRNQSFFHFFRLVAETQPRFFLAENVPGLLDSAFDSIREHAFEKVAEDYTLLPSKLLTSSDFGIPTSRTRVFFLGYREGQALDLADPFPDPSGYSDVCVEMALAGLPEEIDPDWTREDSDWLQLGEAQVSEYLESMTDSVPAGAGDPEALARLNEGRWVSGCRGTTHTPGVEIRFRLLDPGEVDAVSRARRLDPKGFAPTLRSGTGAERGSFQALRPIHPTQPRVITVREAARLQSFPDWFVFDRTKWHAFRQIGNSVPPLLAERLLAFLT